MSVFAVWLFCSFFFFEFVVRDTRRGVVSLIECGATTF